MNEKKFPWALYMPGITLVAIGVLILILPKVFVAFAAAILFICGGVTIMWAKKIHGGLKARPNSIEWNIFRYPW